MREGFDVVVIDSPPRMGGEARAAMLAADLVVVPVTLGAAGLWAARGTVAVLDGAQSLRPELRAAVILNRADRTTLARMASKAIEVLGVASFQKRGILDRPGQRFLDAGDVTT